MVGKARPLPAFEVALHPRLVAAEAMTPVAVELRRDDRCVVGPAFKSQPVTLDQSLQIARAVGLAACLQGHVLGPFHPLDGIDLHETKLIKQCRQPAFAQSLVVGRTQALQGQHNMAALGIGEGKGCRW